MAASVPPVYRTPSNQLVLADGVGVLAADLIFVDALNPLPVVQAIAVPGDYTMIPSYLDPNQIKVAAEGVAIVLNDGSIVGPGNPLPTTGGGGGPVAAEDVSLDGHSPLDNVQEALDYLLYVDVDITSMTGGSQNEIGASVADVDLDWTINKDVTSQSISNGVGVIDPALRTLNIPGPFTTNQTWTLTASDGTTQDQASQSVTFLPKRYWGVSPETSLDNAEILALSQELSNSKSKAITYDCTGGKYPYFVYPSTLGPLSSVTVGGLAFSDFTQSIQSVTNAQGFTQNYYVTRFNGIQTGAAINVVWS